MKKTIYINYNHGIDSQKVNVLIGATNNLVNNGYKSIQFLINSGGGEVNAGIALYNYLKASPVEIVMHNMGSIDSIANVVFLAGDKRYACPHATFLFHGVTVGINSNLSLFQLKEIADRMEKDQKKIMGIICDNTMLKENQLKKLFTQGETQNSSFAIKHGIIEDARFPQIPQNAEIITIDFNK